MLTTAANRGYRSLTVTVLLIALVTRALVPMGFMPAADHSFSLEICPDGFPAKLLHRAAAHEYGMHHSGSATHHHGSARSEHCVFAAVSSAGPAANALVVRVPLDNSFAPLFDTARPAYRTQLFRVQQPRAPPAGA